MTSDNFVVVDITGEPVVIAEVSFPAALTSLHEKAIYLHEARQYHVERFDYEERKAYVRQVECDYFTDAIDYTQVKVLARIREQRTSTARSAAHGDVRVNRQIVGFKKIKFYTLENVGAGKLSMPEQEMHTTAFWLHFPAEFLGAVRGSDAHGKAERADRIGQRAAQHGGAAADVRSARSGGGAMGTAPPPAVFEPDLYLYDNYPGGVGQSAPLYRDD